MNQKEFLNQGQYLISECKTRSLKADKFFFNDDTMRFFKSRISDLCWKIKDDIYFITSEKHQYNLSNPHNLSYILKMLFLNQSHKIHLPKVESCDLKLCK